MCLQHAHAQHVCHLVADCTIQVAVVTTSCVLLRLCSRALTETVKYIKNVHNSSSYTTTKATPSQRATLCYVEQLTVHLQAMTVSAAHASVYLYTAV
jgi:hypothetical protein